MKSSSTTNPSSSGIADSPRGPHDAIAAFELPSASGDVDVWLQGTKPRPVFFKEFLPACFTRRLEFDACALGEAELEWVFTGPESKVTLTLSDGELRLQQGFHDSFYLNDPKLLFDQDYDVPRGKWFQAEMSDFDGETGINIHPEQRWKERRVALNGPVQSLAVRLSHDTELAVYLNGERVIAQNSLQDLHRHQLRLSDGSGRYVGRLLAPQSHEVRAIIREDRPRQNMIGFGGTAIPTAYAELSEAGKECFWDYVEAYNLRIQRENPIAGELNEAMDNWDNLDDAIPHYYGDCFPNGNISDFALNKEFLQRGGEFWFEYWHFPKWMVYDGETYLDEKGKERADPVRVDAYAASIVEYCRQAQQKAGAPPAIVGVQNENSHPRETYHAMVAALRDALDAAGFEEVKIHMSDANMLSPDSNWGKLYADSITRAKTFTEKPETWAKIDYAAAHMYDYQEYFQNPDGFDAPMDELHALYGEKPFLSTELCVNSPRYQMRSYRIALLMGELMHKNLDRLDAASVLFCWTLLNVEQPSYAWTRALLTIDRENGFLPVPTSHQLRVFGSWSRHIHKGMRRVEVDCDDPDLLVTAFVGEDAAKTLVALNRSNAPVWLDPAPWSPTDFDRFERTSPYEQNAAVEIDADAKSFEIPPGAILTATSS